MRIALLLAVFTFAVVPTMVGCHMFHGTDTDAAHACTCADGKAGTSTWCADCNKGFVGGKVATTCKGCFAAKTGGPACEACAKK